MTPEPVFEALRVVGTVYHDGFGGPMRRRVVHKVTLISEPAMRLQDAIGGDAFLVLYNLVANSEEDEATGLLRMAGGQLRVRRMLGWGEDRVRKAFRRLEDAGFATAEQSKELTATGRRFGVSWLIPNPRLCDDPSVPAPEVRTVAPTLASGFPEPRNPEARGSSTSDRVSPVTRNLEAGKPRSEPKTAGQPRFGVPGTGEARNHHEMDDDVSSSSSAWDEKPAGLPPERRSKTDARTVGDLAANLFQGADRRISGEPDDPSEVVVGIPQKGSRLRPGASFEEVVSALSGLGFTDARKFATQHWNGNAVQPWVNYVLTNPTVAANPGAYIRAAVKAGTMPPSDEAPTPAQGPPSVSSSGTSEAPGQRQTRPTPSASASSPPVPAADDLPDEPTEPGPPDVSSAEIEQILADLPSDVADQITEAVRSALGASASWVMSDQPSAAARIMLKEHRTKVLWQFDLLNERSLDRDQDSQTG